MGGLLVVEGLVPFALEALGTIRFVGASKSLSD